MVLLRHSAMRILRIEALEAIAADLFPVDGEVGMPQSFGRGGSLLRIVDEELREQIVSLLAERAGRDGGVATLAAQGGPVPLLERGCRPGRAASRRSETLQLAVFRLVNETGPAFLGGHAQDLDNLLQLVPLERHRLLPIHLGLLALEDRTEAEELGEDTAHGPHVNGRRVVLAPQQELRRAVPYGDHDLVTCIQRMKRFVEDPSKAEIANLDLTATGDHDIRRLQITVQDPIAVQVQNTVEQLEEDALDGRCRDRVAGRLGVVVDDLKQIVFGVLEHHENALVLEDDLDQVDEVGVGQLRTKGHLTTG